MKINLKKNYRYLLLISLLLVGLGILLSTLFTNEKDAFNQPINKILFNFPWFVVVFFVVIFAPISEELSFRSWACKKSYWKWISFSFSSIFVCIANIYMGIIYALIFLAIIFFLKNKPKERLFSFLILTSLAFASLHYANLLLKDFLFAFPQYLGMGLLFSYFTLRFNLFTAIIIHAINNGFALVMMGLL